MQKLQFFSVILNRPSCGYPFGQEPVEQTREIGFTYLGFLDVAKPLRLLHLPGPLRKRAAEKPGATKGSKLARQMRQECNQLKDEQRAELLGEAMAVIYGDAVASKAVRP